jgi:hypothetical protein
MTASRSYTFVSVIPRLVAITRTPGSISWKRSRSPVTTITSKPWSRARRATVAITSSASKPSTRTFSYPKLSTSGSMCGHCSASRSGFESRCPLYSS